MTNTHNIFICSIIIVVVVFCLMILGCIAIMKEPFRNIGMEPMKKKKKKVRWDDTTVAMNLGYSDITDYYNSLDNGLEGTSLVNISSVDSNRYPIMIETPTNWYNTQPMILEKTHVGYDSGKLPSSKCICSDPE